MLDAGCGTGYGAAILAEAGAASVTGVDIAESVLDSVASSMPEEVRLMAGDLRTLDLPDDGFGLVVCFEVIEDVQDPEAVLDELVRVLAPGGVLVVSSSNRGAYPEGDRHRLPELAGAELRRALEARLSEVRLVRQHDYMLSALLSDLEDELLAGVELLKLAPDQPGQELYSVAVAGNDPLPEMTEVAALTAPLQLSDWLTAAEEQARAIDEQRDQIAELERRAGDRDRLLAQLTDAEQRTASIPDLRERIEELERELAASRQALETSRAEARHLDERLMSSERVLREVFSSPSWQVTKPLRYAKRRLKG